MLKTVKHTHRLISECLANCLTPVQDWVMTYDYIKISLANMKNNRVVGYKF